MFASKLSIFLRRDHSLPIPSIIPLMAGCLMLCASILPWFNDPLQGYYSAWKLPVDIGWQFHTGILSYGLICTCCAIFVFFTAYVHFTKWKQSNSETMKLSSVTTLPPEYAQVSGDRQETFRDFSPSIHHQSTPLAQIAKKGYFEPGYVSSGMLCMVPFFLFLLQYLWADLHGIDVLVQHTTQALLIQQHLGYSISSQLIPLVPFKFSGATLWERLVLLMNHVALGVFVPLVSGWLLIHYRRFSWLSGLSLTRKWSKQSRLALTLFCLLLLIVILGRSPAAMLCEDAAESSLAVGDNVTALKWLNAALFLNPALDQVSYFHIDRGQAYYTLHPYIQNDDSRVYLAFEYRRQGDYLDAEQEITALWRAHPTTSWVVAEASVTFEMFAEFSQNKNGPPVQRAENDVATMTKLQLLSKVDPSNVYGHYVIGRLQYYLHSYGACNAQMTKVLQLSRDADIQSSAYTYIGLSIVEQGNIMDARKYLFKALDLDPNYHNNTAREELSGLH